MGLMDKIRGELIDIVEWTDDTRDTIVWRFPRHENEIKMNAKLVVREGQTAVFVNEGTIADVFSPGTHTLETPHSRAGSTVSRARSRQRCTSSAPGSSPISSGAPRTLP